MINAILDLSKIESSSITLDDDEIDVEAIIDSVLLLVALKAELGEIELVKIIAADLPRLTADEVRVKQMLSNLLSNAIKFTPPGGTVRLGGESCDDGVLKITVSDTGICISVENIPLILQPFGQVGGVMTRKFEGTGLGLPLARKVAEAHGGTLRVGTSRLGGARFTLVLPLSLDGSEAPTVAGNLE